MRTLPWILALAGCVAWSGGHAAENCSNKLAVPGCHYVPGRDGTCYMKCSRLDASINDDGNTSNARGGGSFGAPVPDFDHTGPAQSGASANSALDSRAFQRNQSKSPSPAAGDLGSSDPASKAAARMDAGKN